MSRERTLRRAVACLATVLGLAVLAAIVADVIFGVGFAEARDSFQIPNLCVGVPAASCGLLLAWHRPRNGLGWLLAGAGTAQVMTAAVTPWLIAAMRDGWPTLSVRSLSTVYSLWPLSIAMFLPLSILAFPDGRIARRARQALAVLVVANGVFQVLLFSSDRNPLSSVQSLAGRAAPSWLRVPALSGAGWVHALSNAVLGLAYLLVLASGVVRYRSGDEQRQRQLLWLMWAASLAGGLLVGSRLVLPIEKGFPILALSLIALVPVSMTVAVLRHQVLDIRLVWARTVAWLLLTSAVLAAYLGLVAAGDTVLRHTVVPSAAVATLLVAAAFHPARQWLQRMVDARLYGDRADPVRAAAAVSSRLSAEVSTPADVLAAVRSALRLPYAELRDTHGVVATDGTPVEPVEEVALRYAGRRVGTLVVGVRSGQARLDASDKAVLDLMAVPLGLAVHATALASTVEQAHAELTAARATERRRLRRDLHDGLGPLLTGIAFRVDTARNVSAADPDGLACTLQAIRTSVSDAIGEVRVLLEQLRPTTVEELGLTAALERHAASLARRSDGTRLLTVIEPDGLPELPAQVETATYRILTEALNNVARHSRAERVDIEFSYDGAFLSFVVQDDGGASEDWQPGVGLRSMQERIAELSGTISAGPTPLGGRVCARIPVEVVPP